MSTTYNMAIVGSASALVATLNVTITYGAATSVIATKGSRTVGLTYDSTNDIWTGNLDSTGTWTVYATDGVRTVSQTVNVGEIGVYEISIAAPNIPLGYTQLEWISSTGAQINTNYMPVSACKIMGKMQTMRQSTASGYDDSLFSRQKGIWSDWNRYQLTFTNNAATGNSPGFFYYNGIGSNSVTIYGASVNTVYEYSTNGASVTINGSTSTISGGTRITDADTYMYFGYYAKTWYFKMTDSGGSTLVRDYVPAKRNFDSAIGMYDKVNGVFYTSSNSSTFTAGPEVN